MNRIVRIGTRESKLAVIQAELVAEGIKKSHPEIEIQLVKLKTTGDKIQDRTLDTVGGKGLFVKELDEALLRGDADISAHSYKDVPAEDNPDMPIVAVSLREDPRDVLILPLGAKEIDPSKPIGCTSGRRQVQLARLYPGQAVAPVRGNVLSRLEKLDRGEYSALVLAAAGVKRLDLMNRVSRTFESDEMLPSNCQGIIAVQGLKNGDFSYLAAYHDQDAWDAAAAERAFVRRLGIGCGAPVGAYAEVKGNALTLRGMVAGEDKVPRYGEIAGSRGDAEALGVGLAEKLLKDGAL